LYLETWPSPEAWPGETTEIRDIPS
jgi:hypothetical protein